MIQLRIGNKVVAEMDEAGISVPQEELSKTVIKFDGMISEGIYSFNNGSLIFSKQMCLPVEWCTGVAGLVEGEMYEIRLIVNK